MAEGGCCLTRYPGGGKMPQQSKRPHRLGDQDAALSRLKPRFESEWGHKDPPPGVVGDELSPTTPGGGCLILLAFWIAPGVLRKS
jgi:hypothetical protein